LTAVLVWPFITFLKTMKEISIIAVFGMVTTTFAVIVILVFSVMYHPDPLPKHYVIKAESFPYAFATFVFAFGGHNVFPTIQDSMRTTKNFKLMFNIAFVMIMALYLPPCIVGYYYFGEQTASPILHNLKAGVVTDIATIAITLHIWFTLPIIDNPVNLWIEQDWLKVDNSKYEIFLRSGTRTLLLAIQTGIAIGVPFFGDVMAFIGASCVSATVFVLPCIMYLKFYWNMISVLEIIWIFIILLGATLGSTIGLYSATLNIIGDLGATIHTSEAAFYGVLFSSAVVGSILILISFFFIAKSQKK